MAGPSFVLSTRWQPRGGEYRTVVREEVRPNHSRPWLVYVHGHNVDRAYALMQEETLRRSLHLPGVVQTGLFLWPSDLWRYRTAAKLAYPAMAERAARVGRILADYLLRHNDRVILVGHSLGALVAVSAARDLLLQQRPLQAFVLLGAAVEVEQMAQPTGEFRTAPLAVREAVAFCPEDRVLRTVFRPGQWLARPFGPRSEAVGLWGEPAARGWLTRRTRVSDHSYWQSEESGALVAQVLTSPPSGRAPDSWTLPDRPVPRREVPE